MAGWVDGGLVVVVVGLVVVVGGLVVVVGGVEAVVVGALVVVVGALVVDGLVVEVETVDVVLVDEGERVVVTSGSAVPQPTRARTIERHFNE